MYKIYKITNKKRPYELYVGSTKKTLEKRLAEHAYHKDSSVYPYIQKYGRDNFEISAIDYANTKEEAFKKEEFWTLFLMNQGYFLYNKKAGNMLFEEQKRKLSEANKGENGSMYGKHHTEEVKIKISKANKGRHHTEEEKSKISKANKGKHRSKETRKKISKATKGGNNPRARKIRCIDDNKVFNCIKDAANFYNINRTGIRKCCQGKLEHTHGLHFEYI